MICTLLTGQTSKEGTYHNKLPVSFLLQIINIYVIQFSPLYPYLLDYNSSNYLKISLFFSVKPPIFDFIKVNSFFRYFLFFVRFMSCEQNGCSYFFL